VNAKTHRPPAPVADLYLRLAKLFNRLWKRKRLVWAIFLVGSHLAGALTSIQAIMEVRTAQGAVAWVFALNTVPYISVPAYWVFGRSKFNGYVLARRADLAMTHPITAQFRSNLTARGLVAQPRHDHNLLSQKLAAMPFTLGNDAELLVDGEATFASIFEGIERATSYILLEFYIIRPDKIGTELKERLKRKASEGVRVHIIFDEIGSSQLRGKSFSELERAGVLVREFNTRQGPNNRWQLNFRNHRKILVVDGKAAWVGGLNVGDEYLGNDARVGRWRDTHVKVTGPVVQEVQMAFFEDWHWATQETLRLDWNSQPAPSGVSRMALALPTGPADRLETCTLFFINAINAATNRLWLATPYFVPDEQFVTALQLAALRGVDVHILIPDRIDNKLVQMAGWSYLSALEKVGIEVSRYTNGLMHQKVMLIDDVYATIGTANFDNRSFRLNFEITMAFVDQSFADQVRRMLENDFANAETVRTERLEEKGFWFLFGVRCARLMAPVL
jgi:cardiolipin synthase